MIKIPTEFFVLLIAVVLALIGLAFVLGVDHGRYMTYLDYKKGVINSLHQFELKYEQAQIDKKAEKEKEEVERKLRGIK